MGKRGGSKRTSISSKQKLLPQRRREITMLVEQLFKMCSAYQPAGSSNSQQLEKFSQLYSLVEQIRLKEQDICIPSYQREKHFEAFLKWMNQNDIKMDGAKIYNYDRQGFGLRATRLLSPGDLIISVPEKCIISEETAKKSFLGPLMLKDPILQHMSNVALAVHLLGEYADLQSFWQPYLRILPQNYNTVLYFGPEEMKLLVGSPIFEESIKQFQNIARQYAYFYRLLHTLPEARSWPIKEIFTFDSYRWAVSTVMTRVNKIPSKSSNGQLALIPTWDLANHQYGQLSTDFDESNQLITCFAQSSFSLGEQITIYYGSRSNAEFFLHSAFVYEDNPDDLLSIKLGVSKKDPLFDSKSSLLSSLSVPSSGAFLIRPGKHPISEDLLCFIRIFCMDKESLDYWTNCGNNKRKDLSHIDCDVGTRVEDKAMQFLFNRISLLIKSYPTTLEADEDALLIEIDVKRKLILSVLIEEKKILRNASAHLSNLFNNKIVSLSAN